MKGGPKPQPVALKIIRGNPGQHALNMNSPEDAGPLGDAPAHWTPAQKLLWHEVVNAAPRGILTKSDRILIEIVVRNLAKLRDGTEITSALSAELRRCLGELGMTPGERSRMIGPKDEVENPFGRF